MSTRSMRAKMIINKVERYPNQECLTMSAVCKAEGYGPDGHDEDNTFALFSPAGQLTLTITNPALLGNFNPGDKYYLDFFKAE